MCEGKIRLGCETVCRNGWCSSDMKMAIASFNLNEISGIGWSAPGYLPRTNLTIPNSQQNTYLLLTQDSKLESTKAHRISQYWPSELITTKEGLGKPIIKL